MSRKKDKKRRAEQAGEDVVVPAASPGEPPANAGQGAPHFELGRPRSLFSIFIDALTAIVVVEGCMKVIHTFPLPASAGYGFDFVEGSIWDRDSLLRVATFGTLFWFLLSDWADARAMDVWSPTTPSAKGMRFYLDVAIAVAFLPAFDLVTKFDARLAGWISIIFLLCALWAARIRFAEGAPPGLRICCQHYIPMHLKGFLLFLVLEWGLFLSRKAGYGLPVLTYRQEALFWILVAYWGWELFIWIPGKIKLKELERQRPG